MVSWPFLLLTACLLLPVIGPAPAGWLFFLIPLAVSLVLLQRGREKGATQVAQACLLALVPALVFASWKAIALGVALVPAGFVLDHARRRLLPPALTGGLVTLALGLALLGYWGIYGMVAGFNPYTMLLRLLIEAVSQGQQLYVAAGGDISREHIEAMGQVASMLHVMIPRILPGILGIILLLTAWCNLVLSARLAPMLRPEERGWPRYSQWSLPEQLVWLPIIGGILLLLGPGTSKQLGGNLLLLAAVIYLFQGLAVLAHFMHRWQVARPFKALVWFTVLVQSLGLAALAVLGLADTWGDFRRLAGGRRQKTEDRRQKSEST